MPPFLASPSRAFTVRAEEIHIAADDNIRTDHRLNRAFRSVVKGQAGHTQEGSLLLNSAAVCDDNGAFFRVAKTWR